MSPVWLKKTKLKLIKLFLLQPDCVLYSYKNNDEQHNTPLHKFAALIRTLIKRESCVYRNYAFEPTMWIHFREQNIKAAHHFLENTVVHLDINYDIFSSESCNTSCSKCYRHISESTEGKADIILMDTKIRSVHSSVKGEETCSLLLVLLLLCNKFSTYHMFFISYLSWCEVECQCSNNKQNNIN